MKWYFFQKCQNKTKYTMLADLDYCKENKFIVMFKKNTILMFFGIKKIITK